MGPNGTGRDGGGAGGAGCRLPVASNAPAEAVPVHRKARSAALRPAARPAPRRRDAADAPRLHGNDDADDRGDDQDDDHDDEEVLLLYGNGYDDDAPPPRTCFEALDAREGRRKACQPRAASTVRVRAMSVGVWSASERGRECDSV